MSFSVRNWGFLVSGFSGDFLGGASPLTPRLWFTTGVWLFRNLCLLRVPWQTRVFIHTYKTPRSGSRETEWRAMPILSSPRPSLFYRAPNHLRIIGPSLNTQGPKVKEEHANIPNLKNGGQEERIGPNQWSGTLAYMRIIWRVWYNTDHFPPTPDFLLNIAPIICLSNKSLGDVDTAGWKATL